MRSFQKSVDKHRFVVLEIIFNYLTNCVLSSKPMAIYFLFVSICFTMLCHLRSLQAEYDQLISSRTEDGIQPLNHVDLATTETRDAEMLAEAKLLQQHKSQLEVRMKILEDHNRQLEAQLHRLRQLLDEVQIATTLVL